MCMRAVGIVTISLSIAAAGPAAAQKRLDLSLNGPGAPGDFEVAPRTSGSSSTGSRRQCVLFRGSAGTADRAGWPRPFAGIAAGARRAREALAGLRRLGFQCGGILSAGARRRSVLFRYSQPTTRLQRTRLSSENSTRNKPVTVGEACAAAIVPFPFRRSSTIDERVRATVWCGSSTSFTGAERLFRSGRTALSR